MVGRGQVTPRTGVASPPALVTPTPGLYRGQDSPQLLPLTLTVNSEQLANSVQLKHKGTAYELNVGDIYFICGFLYNFCIENAAYKFLSCSAGGET